MSLGKYSDSIHRGAVSITDKYGTSLTPSEEVAAIKREGVRGSDELPDIGPEHFETLEDYAEWVMAGRQRFICS
jgi:hypothetical protein